MSSSNKWKKYIALGGMLFLFPLVWLLFFGFAGEHKFLTLPFYDPEHGTTAVDSTQYVLPDFSFVNQEGEVITRDSLKGKIWLAAFYNLADPHLSRITERLRNVDFKYRKEPDIRIVVFSTQSEHDTQPLRAEYIHALSKYHTYPNKWDFLVGNPTSMDSFIHNGFFIQDLSNEAIFRLVDEKGHIRGLYGNTEYHIGNAMEDIALLRKESDIRKHNELKAKRSKKN